MTRSIERQLIDGVWTTVDVEESGGGASSPLTLEGTADEVELTIKQFPAQSSSMLRVTADNDAVILDVASPGTAGMQYKPNPNNNGTEFALADDGGFAFTDADGDDYVAYTYGNKTLDLDPTNGQVYVRSGNLVTAGSEPADATLAFNGCVSLYVEGNDLKAKAKIGGVFVHLTIGTFA